MTLPPDGTTEPCREPGCDQTARFNRNTDDTRPRSASISSGGSLPPRQSGPGWKCQHGHIRFVNE
jgi:hypothetical protein